MTWTYDPAALGSILEHANYDVDVSQARGLGGGGSLSARRDRANGTVLVAIDSGGRVKITITRPLGTPATSEATVDDLPVRILIEETRTETIATDMAETANLRPLLGFVDQRLAGEENAAETTHNQQPRTLPRDRIRLLDERKDES